MFLFRLPKIEQSLYLLEPRGFRQIIKLSFISTRGPEKLYLNIRRTSARRRFATVNFVRYSINWVTKPPQFVRKQCSLSSAISSPSVRSYKFTLYKISERVNNEIFDIIRLCLRREFSMRDQNSWKAGNGCHCKIIRNTHLWINKKAEYAVCVPD